MPDTPLYAVTSAGLWSPRAICPVCWMREIGFLAACCPVRSTVFWVGGTAIGAEGARALQSPCKPLMLVEDGFLKGHAPGRSEPSLSFVIDRTGMYFAPDRPNDCQTLIDTPLDDADVAGAGGGGDGPIRAGRISKHNNAPSVTWLGQAAGDRDFVLLVDQVAGDASIAGAGASEASFEAMLSMPQPLHGARTGGAHPSGGGRKSLSGGRPQSWGSPSPCRHA